MLSARAFLAASVRHFEHHVEIGSTNDRAVELARDAAIPLPALVVADRQTTGRGRGANRWWSADGALMFSLAVELGQASGIEGQGSGTLDAEYSPAPSLQLLSPSPSAPRPVPLVPLVAGLAVCEALKPVVPASAALSIKWPNDVYAAGRKLAGILVEAPAGAPALPRGGAACGLAPARVVIGVGLNVNNSLAAAPPDVRERAVSLVELTGRPHDLDATLAAIVGELFDLLPSAAAELAGDAAADLERTSSPSYSPLAERWGRWCLLSGNYVEVDTPAGPVAGLCEGIDEDGALLVRNELGQARCVAGTVVKW